MPSESDRREPQIEELMGLSAEEIAQHVSTGLREDLGESGDLSSHTVIPEQQMARGRILAKAQGVLAGTPLARACFLELDPGAEFLGGKAEGETFDPGALLLEVRGRARALLGAERSALNFLQRLSGIATLTRAFALELEGTGTVLLETRKTTPGLRQLEKYAVRVGGGKNHRFGLFDRVMLKENHFALSGHGTDPGGYRKTVSAAVAAGVGAVIAEVRDRAEAEAALRGGAEILLFDNMSPDQLGPILRRVRALAQELGRQVLCEASGGITLANVRAFADTGVDRVSVGALTHSALPIDLSMSIRAAGTIGKAAH
ncbi:MAG: carboxylating nicotinate-nucleotide diphosphorylase [Planctomycetota bacterium]